jgi:hypothetical protein
MAYSERLRPTPDDRGRLEPTESGWPVPNIYQSRPIQNDSYRFGSIRNDPYRVQVQLLYDQTLLPDLTQRYGSGRKGRVNLVIESGEMGDIACSDLTPLGTWRNANFHEVLEGGRAQAGRNIPSPTWAPPRTRFHNRETLDKIRRERWTTIPLDKCAPPVKGVLFLRFP